MLLEGIRTPFLNAVFGMITRLGEETVAVVILCAVFWCINKRIAYIIGIAYFLSGLTVQGMKICFRIDRPWITDPALAPVPSALAGATGYSFPSGHTQSAAALFGSIATQTKRIPAIAGCLLLIILVAFSRMYLGVHTPLDVIASLLISLIFILLTIRFFAGRPAGNKRQLVLSVFMVGYAIAALVLALTLYANGTIEMSYADDCLKAAGAGVGFAAGMYIERVYIDFSVRAKNIFLQILKLVIGIAGAFVIKEGLALLFGGGLAVDMLRYFLALLWVTALFPLIIKRFFALPPAQ